MSAAPTSWSGFDPWSGFENLGSEPAVIKGLWNSAALNLPLAARPHVGHIGLTGDVAEWLKAAVC
jgi:hypothetical protein